MELKKQQKNLRITKIACVLVIVNLIYKFFLNGKVDVLSSLLLVILATGYFLEKKRLHVLGKANGSGITTTPVDSKKQNIKIIAGLSILATPILTYFLALSDPSYYHLRFYMPIINTIAISIVWLFVFKKRATV